MRIERNKPRNSGRSPPYYEMLLTVLAILLAVFLAQSLPPIDTRQHSAPENHAEVKLDIAEITLLRGMGFPF